MVDGLKLEVDTYPVSPAPGSDGPAWAEALKRDLAKLSTAIGVSAQANNFDGNDGDDTGAWDALMEELYAEAANGYRFNVIFEDGIYGLKELRPLPWNVNVESRHHWGATFKNLGDTLVPGSTSPTTFLVPRGHGQRIEGLVFDGQRENIPLPNASMDGYLSIQFTPPPSESGPGTTLIAGGVKLAAGVSTGAKQITTNRAYSVHPQLTNTDVAWANRSPILPGVWLAIVEGMNYEWVKVHKDYVYGSTTVPLEGELTQAFTTAAYVAITLTGNVVKDCKFLGSGIQMVCAHGNLVTGCDFANQIDCAAGHFDRGNRFNKYIRNVFQTDSTWVYVEDEWSGINAPGTLAPNEDNAFCGNICIVERGGPDYGTAAGSGSIEAMYSSGSYRLVVEDNFIDMRKATGPNFRGGISLFPGDSAARIKRNVILGAYQANSVGVRVITLGGTDANCDPDISDNEVVGFPVAIDLGQSISSRTTGNKLRAISNQGIAQTYVRSDGAPAFHTIDGNDISGTGQALSYGIYLNSGATVPAGSGYRGHNTVQGFATKKVLAANYEHNPGAQDA